MNAAWIKLYSPFVENYTDFEGELKKLTHSIVEKGKQLALHWDEENIAEILHSPSVNVITKAAIGFWREKEREGKTDYGMLQKGCKFSAEGQ